MTLDVLLDAHGAPGLVKLDIEGAEAEALAAAPRLLAARPALVVETHSDHNHVECRRILAESGYTVETSGGKLVATASRS